MLEVQVPDEVFGNFNIGSIEPEKFVLEAIKEKIERENQNNFAALLAEGYQATRAEDSALTKEFAAADFENL